MTIEDFIKHSIEVCLSNKQNLSKDTLEKKLNYLKNNLNIFRIKITENGIYPSTSSAVEIPKVKDITFTRFDLSIKSVEKYRKKRKKIYGIF